MADTKKTAAATAVPKYTVNQLRPKCLKLFGVTTSTYDAATYKVDGDLFSVDEMRTIINRWMKKPVKKEGT